MDNVLYTVIPCFNEEEALFETAKRLKEKYTELIKREKINQNSRIIFVNDGSTDNTWEMIDELCKADSVFGGIKLSRNRGHQNALLAGLLTVKDYADMVISMDADLQDDINAIDEMVQKYLEGYDIVYGVRSKREKDTIFKKFSAECFYKIIKLMGGEIVFNHADFRLMSKRTIDGLSQFREVNLFLRGIVPIIGYSSTIIMYERNERIAGESKYPLMKMLGFALEGVTSLSVRPMRIIALMGFTVFAISIIMLIYIVARYFAEATVTGWASVAVSIWAIGGLILLSIGILGEYIGKIYLESKERPRFIVDRFINSIKGEEYSE